MKTRTNYEARFYEALLRIAAYDTPNQLRSETGRDYGLEFEEALEYAYENIKEEAKHALRGYRRPKLAAAPLPPVPSSPPQETP